MSNLLILKTNIKTEENVQRVAPIFNAHRAILNWSVDTEDIDNVLRIEATQDLSEEHIIQLMSTHNFCCEELPD